MARKLQDFVNAAKESLGSAEKQSKYLREYVCRIVRAQGIYDKDSVEELADDIIEELEYCKLVPKQKRRKTGRYFPTPIRVKDKREKETLRLAKKFIKQDGIEQAKANLPKCKGDWFYQQPRAIRFLREQNTQHQITIADFVRMIQKLAAQKASETRLVKKRRNRKKNTRNSVVQAKLF